MQLLPAQKAKNQFAALSPEDRQHILNLCVQHPYEEVAAILRKPRSEGGLEIDTSRSALSRFYTNASHEASVTVLAQVAAAANVRHEQNSNAFIGAIRATVEARVFQNLQEGKALADMDKELRFLKTVQTLYLADAQWRAEYPEAAQAAYVDHVARCADLPDADFVPLKDLDPSQATATPSDSTPALPDFDRDVLAVHVSQKQQIQSRDRLIETLKELCTKQQWELTKLQNQMAAAEEGSYPDDFPPRQNGHTSKSPVIPHFPPNPTNLYREFSKNSHVPPESVTPPAQEEMPPTADTPKPVPYVSPTPKIGRNDPCPCGSGRKAKKCCHR